MFGLFVVYYWNTHTRYGIDSFPLLRQISTTGTPLADACRRPFQTLSFWRRERVAQAERCGHNVIVRFTICSLLHEQVYLTFHVLT